MNGTVSPPSDPLVWQSFTPQEATLTSFPHHVFNDKFRKCDRSPWHRHVVMTGWNAFFLGKCVSRKLPYDLVHCTLQYDHRSLQAKDFDVKNHQQFSMIAMVWQPK